MGLRWRSVDLGSSEPLVFQTEPAYLVLTSVEDVAAALGVSSWSASPAVDLSREIIISVHRGERPTGGYAVAVSNLTRTGNLLRVKVTFKDPSPTDFVTMVITYPQAAVAVERRGLEGLTKVSFTDAGGASLADVEVNL